MDIRVIQHWTNDLFLPYLSIYITITQNRCDLEMRKQKVTTENRYMCVRCAQLYNIFVWMFFVFFFVKIPLLFCYIAKHLATHSTPQKRNEFWWSQRSQLAQLCNDYRVAKIMRRWYFYLISKKENKNDLWIGWMQRNVCLFYLKMERFFSANWCIFVKYIFDNIFISFNPS